MSVLVEPATREDADAIARVHFFSLQSSHRAHIPPHLVPLILDSSGLPLRARMWRQWLRRSRVITTVARVNDTLAGFCSMQELRGDTGGVTGELSACFVQPAYWRQGVGRLLCEQAFADARTRAWVQLLLWVLAPNHPARRFYESVGFRPNGETRVFLEASRVTLHELRYHKGLDQRPVGGDDERQALETEAKNRAT